MPETASCLGVEFEHRSLSTTRVQQQAGAEDWLAPSAAISLSPLTEALVHVPPIIRSSC
jgi:hypothetical protein